LLFGIAGIVVFIEPQSGDGRFSGLGAINEIIVRGEDVLKIEVDAGTFWRPDNA
jgi:hypothetical protein